MSFLEMTVSIVAIVAGLITWIAFVSFLLSLGRYYSAKAEQIEMENKKEKEK